MNATCSAHAISPRSLAPVRTTSAASSTSAPPSAAPAALPRTLAARSNALRVFTIGLALGRACGPFPTTARAARSASLALRLDAHDDLVGIHHAEVVARAVLDRAHVVLERVDVARELGVARGERARFDLERVELAAQLERA